MDGRLIVDSSKLRRMTRAEYWLILTLCSVAIGYGQLLEGVVHRYTRTLAGKLITTATATLAAPFQLLLPHSESANARRSSALTRLGAPLPSTAWFSPVRS